MRRTIRIYQWMIFIMIIAAALIILPLDDQRDQYKDDISTLDSVIIAADRVNELLEGELAVLEVSLLILEDEIADYEGSIDSLKQKRIEDKIKYEEEIANIIHIPADSLYRLVTGRLN